MAEDPDIMAFPMAVPSPWEMMQEGMSLRDWFAGQALAGIMANPNSELFDKGRYRMIVDRAYLVADMMLPERKKYEDAK
jgi:hypothetical protein